MRVLVVSVLLGVTAACAAPPQGAAPGAPSASAIAAFLAPPGGVAPQPVALVPAAPAPSTAVAVGPAMPPAATPVVASAEVVLPPWVPFGWMFGPEPGGRLTLSNYSYDTARVQAVLTNGPDCGLPALAVTTDFIMPLNATRIIATPPGVDVCWRREVPTAASQVARSAAPAMPGWADWNRSYTGSGRFIDARL